MTNSDSQGIQFITQKNENCDELLSYLDGMQYPLNIVTPDMWQNHQTCDSSHVDLLYFPSNNPNSAFIKKIKSTKRESPLLYITNCSSLNTFDNELNFCDDFIYWPCSYKELTQRITRLMESDAIASKPAIDTIDIKQFAKMQLLGQSTAFLKTLRLVHQSSKYDSAVLIEGETGTGKELVARAVHYLGPRSTGPFIPVNCGAIPDNLFENEIFGHKRGAYTDAIHDQKGLVEQAEHGTLFLDEIETLSKKGQVVLLRFMQDKMYKPLGCKNYKSVDLRIVVASNQSLLEMVDCGEFRQDLYFRLNVLQIKIPPLRERDADIRLLAEYFLDKYKIIYQQPDKTFQKNILNNLLSYNWPGNVRELENCIHRGFITAIKNEVELDSVLLHSNNQNKKLNLIDYRALDNLDGSMIELKSQLVSQFENIYLKKLLEKTKGNITKAAKIAGKERRAFGKLLIKHAIDRNQFT
ncbi:Response regulator of zinc sigma-54-dependent two-component system [hydrothermal vent metagenome]|uniref:Response regulator of zinc sigma-54-dependent two-component system n=1 Tax=hydrothermal vent metagenome TaxID=652676 RepID=A0A3B0ZRB2_9ZZZZ